MRDIWSSEFDQVLKEKKALRDSRVEYTLQTDMETSKIEKMK